MSATSWVLIIWFFVACFIVVPYLMSLFRPFRTLRAARTQMWWQVRGSEAAISHLGDTGGFGNAGGLVEAFVGSASVIRRMRGVLILRVGSEAAGASLWVSGWGVDEDQVVNQLRTTGLMEVERSEIGPDLALNSSFVSELIRVRTTSSLAGDEVSPYKLANEVSGQLTRQSEPSVVAVGVTRLMARDIRDLRSHMSKNERSVQAFDQANSNVGVRVVACGESLKAAQVLVSTFGAGIPKLWWGIQASGRVQSWWLMGVSALHGVAAALGLLLFAWKLALVWGVFSVLVAVLAASSSLGVRSLAVRFQLSRGVLFVSTPTIWHSLLPKIDPERAVSSADASVDKVVQ